MQNKRTEDMELGHINNWDTFWKRQSRDGLHASHRGSMILLANYEKTISQM